MSQQHENLSALIDGEQHDDGLIDAVSQDAELAAKWQRYHLIRQGLRKELPPNGQFDISAQVAAALNEEATVLAPKQRRWQDLPVVAQVLPLARQGGQFAIAASVAVAMVLGVQQINTQDPTEPFNTTQPQLPGVQGGMSPVSLEQTRPLQQTDMLEQRRRINAFLNDHRQQMQLRTIEPVADEQQAQEQPAQASEDQPE
ncbi:transcriptional regulator [Aestuariibacter halophilus]|uniref:Anti-sigma-E factor RseA n=1 Tax=Fluctibacter halophilus TaxID=226011 RepID=A0ABS8G2E2_9ALTE|nr:RseA family anti-sigma factor [Aestuariibacter halophilus]MCC2614698.1 transcriptional regulator [Aestuariibacter halophilus]